MPAPILPWSSYHRGQCGHRKAFQASSMHHVSVLPAFCGGFYAYVHWSIIEGLLLPYNRYLFDMEACMPAWLNLAELGEEQCSMAQAPRMLRHSAAAFRAKCYGLRWLSCRAASDAHSTMRYLNVEEEMVGLLP